MSKQESERELVGLSVKMDAETAAKLKELMARHGENAATVVRRAMLTLHFVDDEVGVGGRQVRFDPEDRWAECITADWLWSR